jgi:hypothetical protein
MTATNNGLALGNALGGATPAAPLAMAPPIKVLEVSTQLYPAMEAGESIQPLQTVVIDTINEMQNAEYLSYIDPNTQDMMTQKKYANLGVNMKIMVEYCKGFRNPNDNSQTVLIIGPEASGKSYGLKYLDPRTTLWIHADGKPATFRGSSNYRPDRYNYLETKDYPTVKKWVKWAFENRNQTVPFLIFILGHTELIEAKHTPEHKKQLKSVGNFAHKLNIEGAFSNCFMTGVHIDPMTGDQTFYVDTKNDGHSTVRCQEDLFPERYIPNNLEYIRQQIINW